MEQISPATVTKSYNTSTSYQLQVSLKTFIMHGLVYKCCTVHVYSGGPEGQTHGLHQSKGLEHSGTLQQDKEIMQLRASI